MAERQLHEIRASIDAAERLGVSIVLDTRGELAAHALPVRQALLEAPMAALCQVHRASSSWVICSAYR